jgi:hypothetical protein
VVDHDDRYWDFDVDPEGSADADDDDAPADCLSRGAVSVYSPGGAACQ